VRFPPLPTTLKRRYDTMMEEEWRLQRYRWAIQVTALVSCYA
jgi:hypothetical protein